jgi:putative inorganic carbon (HCO3(-)) transporter
MKLKDQSLDYEPLRRTPDSKSVAEDTADTEFHFKKSARTETAADERDGKRVLRREHDAQTESAAREEKSEAKETWIHKHGHSVSYAGIFLFTALVFFRPYELSPSLSWLSSSAFWVALATLVIYVLTQLGLENRLTARPREVNLVLLLTLTGLLSVPLALEPGRAFDRFIEFLKVVLIFIVMVNVIRSEKRLKALWLLVLVASCILSINAINDYRLGRLELQGVRIKGSIGGLFDNPNDLALHLVTIIPIALALSFGSRNPLTKLLSVVTVLLMIGGIVSTFSRGGFLAFLAVGILLIWKLARRSRWLIPVVAAPLVIAFVLFAPGGYRTRLATTGDDSSMARFDDLKRSLFIAARHPLLGVGMDNYILFSNANKASHNSYTQVASEMGAAAAVIYILFIVAPFKGLRRIEHECYQRKPARVFYYASIALQASLVGYMVASFFASVAYLWYIYYLVAYSVCLRRIYDAALEREGAMNLQPGPEVSANVNFANK